MTENMDFERRPPAIELDWERPCPWKSAEARIAFVANPAGHWDIYILNQDGSRTMCLSDDPVEGLFALANVS